MPATIVVGTQWGDEGKGKFTDLVAKEMRPRRPLPGRPQRRPHPRRRRRERSPSSWCPSGILYDHITPVIGNGVVVDPRVLIAEMDMLDVAGASTPSALKVSGNAHLIFPYHQELDRAHRAPPGQEQAGHHQARHRPGLRRQGVAGRPPGPGPARPQDLPREARRASCTRRTRSWPRSTTGCRLDADEIADEYLDAAVPALEPHIADTVGARPRGARGRRARPVRGGPGHVPRPRPRHLSVRHVVQPGRRRRVHRGRRRPPTHRPGHRRSPRPTSPASAPDRSPPSSTTRSATTSSSAATSSAPTPAAAAGRAGSTP